MIYSKRPFYISRIAWSISLLLLSCMSVFAQVPANDNCANVFPLTVGTTCNYVQYTNANATASGGAPEPGCGNYVGGDVWFSAVVPANGALIFDSNTGIITDGAMALYSGTCAALTLIACDDDGSANALMPSISATGLTPGATVYLRFWEFGNDNNGTFSLCVRSFSCSTVNNASCGNADPFCTGVSYDYCNTTNVPSLGQGIFAGGPGYNAAYGCLGSAPNPAFYYLNVASNGSIDFNISQSTNTNVPIDVDFIMWGPFASQGAMCSGILASNIIDCSYSTAAVETANIPNAIAGQWYLVLITNFSNQAGVINFTQTNSGQAGAGTTNCNILTAQPGACASGLYTLSGTLQISNPPATGTLTITNSCGGSQVITAPFTSSTPYSIANLCGNGQACTVTASFSAAGAPTILPASYTAPSCPILTATPGACIGGQYLMSGTLTVGASCLPVSGTLTIASSCGGSVVINAPFSATQNWSLPASNGNGGNCTITAVYSAIGAPLINPINVAEPQCSNCAVNAGTVTTTASNGTVTVSGNSTQVILCPGGSFNLVSNNNYVLPPSYDPGFDDSELFYAIYTSPGPSVTDPDLDPNWTGYYWTAQNFTVANSGGFSSNSSGGCSPLFSLPPVPGFASTSPPNNNFILVPITADDGDNGLDFNGIVNHDQNNDGCFDIGDPISITYLNPIKITPSPNCTGSVSLEIRGGYPEFFSGLYTITNTGAGTLSANQATSGGNVTISGLNAGQTYSISVTSGNGCLAGTYSAIYNGAPSVSINPASSTVCSGCVNLNASVNSGVGNSTQTFSTCAKVAIPDAGIGSTNGAPNVNPGNWSQSCISVSGVCNSVWNTGEIISVNLNISHTWVSDLDIYLQAPNGSYYLLSRDNGGSGLDYKNTTFVATAITPINLGAAPFNGSYIPQGGTGNFAALNGTNINGTWCLWIADDTGGDEGVLSTWSITFGNDNTYTFVWSPSAGLFNANTITPQACPTSSTTYTLTVTNACGCSTSATSSITVNTANTASPASSNPTICVNTPISPNITVTTTGATGIGTATGLPVGVTASWAGNTITISGTPTATGTFNYSIPLTGGCGAVNATGTITVINANTAGLPSSNPLLCINTPITPSITINTSGATGIGLPTGLPAGVTASWASNTITMSGTPTASGTFTYSIPLTGGCGTVNATGSITVNPAPTVTANALSFDVCAGPTAADQSSPGITLSSPQAGTIFNWSLYTGTTPTGAPIQTGTGNPTVPFTNNTCTDQNYVYQVTPALNGCQGNPINIAVRVRPKPTSSFTISPSPACSNQTATVTYTGVSCPGSTYNWTWPAGVTVVSGSGSGPILISFAASGTYPIKLQVVSPGALGGCTSTQTTVNINVNQAVTPTFNLVGPFCSGESISALPTTSINNITGTWSPAINNTTTTTYTFTPTAGQCATTAQLTISINPNRTPTFNYTNQTLCQNAIISLPILNQTSNNGITGVWNPVSVNTSISGPTIYIFTPNAGQCAISYQFITTIVPEANAGTGTSLNLCSSATPIDLFNNLGGTPQTTGIWTGPSVLGNGYLGSFDPATQAAGTYTYTVSGTNPCPNAVSTITINLSANPSASFLYPGAPFCINQAGTISPVLNGTAGGSYSASPAGLSITAGGAITPSSSAPGTYTVVYSIPANGSCPAFVTQNTVSIIAPPGIPTLFPNPICAGNSITITGGNAAWYEFTINGIQVQAPSADNTYVAPTLSAGDQVCVIGHPLTPFAFNGQITEAEWGAPLAISAGGPISGFGASNNLDAIYLKNTSVYLFGALACQTQNNSNNRILLFIDCEAGGYNSLAGWINRTNAPYYSVKNLNSSIQFDAGFEPDYILAMNQASATGYFDLYRMNSNVNTFIGQTGVNPLLGYQNNGGQGIFNAGYEFAIPLSNLNNPTGSIKVFAMLVNDPSAGPPTFISNQFLTPAGGVESNYGNGAINFGLAQPNPISYSLAVACTSQTCITVNPTPVANVSGDNAVCSGESTALSLTSTLAGTTFTWTSSQNGASGASNGSGASINQTLTTTTGGTVNYTITPSSGGCQGTPINTSVTISPTPTLTPIFHE